MSNRLLVIFLALFSPTLCAVDLIAAWRGAQAHDPVLAAAKAAAYAGIGRRDQARAIWRPAIYGSASVGIAGSDSLTTGAQFSAPAFGRSNAVDFGTSISHGQATQWSVNAAQPLYNRSRQAESRQLEAGASAADAALEQAEQDGILRTATQYFDLVLAERAQALVNEQKAAVDRALAEVKDRYRIGDIPITDTHEAQARAEAIDAEQIATETSRQFAFAQFSDQTGIEADALLAPAANTITPPEGTLEGWQDKAFARNPAIIQREAAVNTAIEEVEKFRAVASPTLDIVAQASGDRLSGNGDYGSALIRANRQFIGLQLTVPLYTGGMRSAKHDEALKKLGQARAELLAVKQQVGLQTRSVWMNLNADVAKIRALEAGARASMARLDSTTLGHKVGDRTTLDLLNAENDAYAAKLALDRALVDRVLDQLRLAAFAGELNEKALAQINSQLVAASNR